MREKKTFREHFLPSDNKENFYSDSYLNVDPAQVDRYEFRLYTSKELAEAEEIAEEALEVA